MKKELKILCLQFEPALGNKDKNQKTIAKMLKENADFEPDLVVLPEVWNIGLDYKHYQQDAEFIPAESTMLLSGLAANYQTNIIAGSIIEKTYDKRFFNTSLIINRDGAVISQYRKNYTFSHCGSKETEYVEKSDDITVIDIEGIKFGVAICYDIRFPEHFRKMVKLGAEIFIVPAAFPKERIFQWNILNQARALENQAFLISCNQFGASNIVSPYGEILRTTEKGEKATRNVIDISLITKARTEMPILNDLKF